MAPFSQKLEPPQNPGRFNSLVKKVMTIAFFWTLLKMSDTWIPAIINSFKTIGMAAGGAGGSAPSAATPDGIVSTGFDTALAAYQAIGELGVMEKIAVVIPVTALAILVFLSFLFVAAQLLVTQIESYIAIGGGVILLGFGGSRWTTDMASKYLQYAVATGINESPRVLRRLQLLRKWSHEQEQQIFA
ncbi:type IV secretion system protein, partial [Burkholderia multivorans]|uniref:type IV secretion system protein n=1 Tax=Burkholderia multivorans TaxID=87883 RepID=UPI0028701959